MRDYRSLAQRCLGGRLPRCPVPHLSPVPARFVGDAVRLRRALAGLKARRTIAWNETRNGGDE